MATFTVPFIGPCCHLFTGSSLPDFHIFSVSFSKFARFLYFFNLLAKICHSNTSRNRFDLLLDPEKPIFYFKYERDTGRCDEPSLPYTAIDLFDFANNRFLRQPKTVFELDWDQRYALDNCIVVIVLFCTDI